MVAFLVILAGVVVSVVSTLLWFHFRTTAPEASPPDAESASIPPAAGLNKSEMEDVLDWLENHGVEPDYEVSVDKEQFTFNPRKSA